MPENHNALCTCADSNFFKLFVATAVMIQSPGLRALFSLEMRADGNDPDQVLADLEKVVQWFHDEHAHRIMENHGVA